MHSGVEHVGRRISNVTMDEIGAAHDVRRQLRSGTPSWAVQVDTDLSRGRVMAIALFCVLED